MGELEELKQTFPDIRIVDLQSTGANLYIPNKIISVYWRRRKYVIDGVSKQYDHWGDFIELVNKSLAPKQKVVPEAPISPEKPNGVQKCIDHIKRKQEFIKANQPDNKLAVFCQTLIDELKAYL